ncbi:hypothetical protein FFF34_010110 [Inquilinus sp. KBS0705]|nr:hypothetical protein FFF34_010110 [Inquilinus sp. KBS0705]
MKHHQHYTLLVEHNSETYKVAVDEYKRTTAYYIYELKLKRTRFILVDDMGDWGLIANLKPCESLLNAIISALKFKRPVPINNEPVFFFPLRLVK